eukprot:3534697-Pleurochrysis_carterae.AAC.1
MTLPVPFRGYSLPLRSVPRGKGALHSLLSREASTSKMPAPEAHGKPGGSLLIPGLRNGTCATLLLGHVWSSQMAHGGLCCMMALKSKTVERGTKYLRPALILCNTDDVLHHPFTRSDVWNQSSSVNWQA